MGAGRRTNIALCFLAGFLSAVVFAAAWMLAFAYAGLYDPAATVQDNPVVAWYLRTVRWHGVESRLQHMRAQNLHAERLIRIGAGPYAEMCTRCHLAPGQPESEIRAGLNPPPPRLTEVAGHLDPRRIFCIIEHGIRWTAMPAWGVTHSDDKVWAITAFVKQLPRLSPGRYRAMVASASAEPD